jgi:hypothetical protein
VFFVVMIGVLGTFLIHFANEFSDRHKSRLLRRFIASPIEILGISLLGIAIVIIGINLILPIIVAILHSLF